MRIKSRVKYTKLRFWMYLNGDYRHISSSNATYNLFITTCNYDSGNLVHDLNKCNNENKNNDERNGSN